MGVFYKKTRGEAENEEEKAFAAAVVPVLCAGAAVRLREKSAPAPVEDPREQALATAAASLCADAAQTAVLRQSSLTLPAWSFAVLTP